MLSDFILNYRTVISFGQKNVDHVKDYYLKLLQGTFERDVKIARTSGLLLGFGTCGRVLYLGLMFYCGYYVVHMRFGIDL